MALANIGMLGMGVMGSHLAANLSNHGYSVAVYDKSPEFIDKALQAHPVQNWHVCHSLKDFVSLIQRPRKILIMIAAGQPVDWAIENLRPLLEAGDIIVDGGNSYFKDTQRRAELLKAQDISFIGLGVSGGQTGALLGPALMPGGPESAYEELRPILENIAAKAQDGSPCCYYLGEGGSGHFVKMVHNGIEYADMALICELYNLLKRSYGYSNEAIAEVFDFFNKGPLQSYLIEITASILREKDPETQTALLDLIVDVAQQKGTGKWTMLQAIELGVNCSVLGAGLDTRFMSAKKEERLQAQKIYPHPHSQSTDTYTPKLFLPNTKPEQELQNALYAAKMVAYAQGFSLYFEADRVFHWGLSMQNIASTFRAGCIIRGSILESIREAYRAEPGLSNLLLSKSFSAPLLDCLQSLRCTVSTANIVGMPVPCLSSALNYLDAYRQAHSAANLLQAQRDYFGAHRFERIDKTGSFHHDWEHGAKN